MVRRRTIERRKSLAAIAAFAKLLHGCERSEPRVIAEAREDLGRLGLRVQFLNQSKHAGERRRPMFEAAR